MKGSTSKGFLTLQVMILGGVAVIVLSGFTLWAATTLRLSLRGELRAQTFAIAEAGIEYYRWHLAHGRTDYTDGTGGPGPYTHNYYDKNGDLIGQFILEIIPPPLSSTGVTIKSTGHIMSDATVEKVIKVRLEIPSFAKYAVLSNSNIRFATNTETFGEVLSNGGIRFDGVAHNLVSSAQEKYTDPSHSSSSEFGAHTHVSPVDPFPPTAVPGRPDVFIVGRNFPVPAADFTGIARSLADLKAIAQASGTYIGISGGKGYDMILNASGTYSLYKVNSLRRLKGKTCRNLKKETEWGSWTIRKETFASTGTIPYNGVLFVEDNLWIQGTVNNARVTIAAGKFPDSLRTRKNIIVTTSTRYTNYDGKDVVALIAQNNVNIGFASEDSLRIDAVAVAENGRVGRYYYPNSAACATNSVKTKITTYGMVASNQPYGFSATDGTGYGDIDLTYDANLLYAPPPYFLLLSDQYVQISWDEIK